MHQRALAITVVSLAVLAFSSRSLGQYQPPSERLDLTGTAAYTWSDKQGSIIQLESQAGEAVIQLDDARLTAKSAVLWLTPVKGAILPEQRCQIVLMGDAKLVHGNITRSGQQLLVSTNVRGPIRITSEQRLSRNQEATDLYRSALAVRNQALLPDSVSLAKPPEGVNPALPPSTRPSGPFIPTPAPQTTTSLQLANFQTVQTTDDRVALIATGGILIIQNRADGQVLQLQARQAVLFTGLHNLRDLEKSDMLRQVREQLRSVYLEGDVRITYSPAAGQVMAEQRLMAERAYYEFQTDRAVLTDAILLTADTKTNIPIIVRAQTVRQLSAGEYSAKDVELSTSSFATPSYSLAARKAYIKQSDTGDADLGTRTSFQTTNTTMQMWGVPLFWLPRVSGSVTERGVPLRDFQVENSNRFGTAVRTEWGLFESLGKTPPPDLDARYRLDYYSDRGPATGLDAEYGGGLVSAITGEPWNFRGRLRSFALLDHGTDEFGGSRIPVEPENEFRGRFRWEHQHYLPDDWQVQLRAAYVSDPTFMEQWLDKEFESNQPQDLMAYIKHQHGTRALTFLANYQLSDFVTTSDAQQEQFEVERLPQLGYYQTGYSLWDDNLTFYSANTLARLRFNTSSKSLADQGFGPGLSPGLPSLGTTGTPSDETYRGDFRQELDLPFSAGQFRVVPYIMGRYTAYTNSVDGGSENRMFVGTGVRMNTAFWKVSDGVESSLFDIHRMRHVVEPHAHVFASGQSTDRSKLLIYDEDVDAINDLVAAQVGIRQRWQTKRGGPGRWRNVDVFTLNVEGNFFSNAPSDADLNPVAFRGLFFDSLPEASIPRNSVNVDAIWRISDTTSLLSDAQYNLDENTLATAAVGLAVRHQPQVSWFIGTRYIEQLNSNIATVAIEYQLTPKYSVSLGQSYDFGENDTVGTNATIYRRFDRFVMALRVYNDSRNNVSGISFNLFPENLAPTFATDTLRGAFE